MFEFIREPRKKSKVYLTSLEVRKLLSQGCIGYLAHVIDKRIQEKLKIDDVPVAQDFQEVIPEDLPSLTPDREIEFEINLVPGMEPISKVSYRMALAKLKELHKQL